MRCRHAPLAKACSNIATKFKTLSSSDVTKIRLILHTHKDLNVKFTTAQILATRYKQNKNIKSLLKRSMNNKRPAVRLASTIAMFKYIDQSAKIKKALAKFSKSKNAVFQRKANLALQQTIK